MAIDALSTTVPAVQSGLLPLTFRPVPPIDDPRSAVELLNEIRRTIEVQEACHRDTPTLLPASLPPLSSALSRRAAIFGGFNG